MRSAGVILPATLALGAGGAMADGLTCIAEQQCRGDAERMCAPSTLEIDVKRRGAGAWLWIDHQGPYGARMEREGDITRFTLNSFGGRYQLALMPDGRFLYRGNRGKRFTGRCEGEL